MQNRTNSHFHFERSSGGKYNPKHFFGEKYVEISIGVFKFTANAQHSRDATDSSDKKQ